MFEELEETNSRPAPFQVYTADALWTDSHISKKFLKPHLNEDIADSSVD